MCPKYYLGQTCNKIICCLSELKLNRASCTFIYYVDPYLELKQGWLSGCLALLFMLPASPHLKEWESESAL